MNRTYTNTELATRIWLTTTLFLAIGFCVFAFFANWQSFIIIALTVGSLLSLVISLPALVILAFAVYKINRLPLRPVAKLLNLLLITFIITLFYGFIAGYLDDDSFYGHDLLKSLKTTAIATAILFFPAALAIAHHHKKLLYYFNDHSKTQINIQMETYTQQQPTQAHSTSSNKVLIKGIITGILILVMLIPTLFVINLIQEREERQKQVVAEVSSKWAGAQRITGPYISVPYTDTYIGANNVLATTKRNVILLPEDLTVNGDLVPENRKRSIYNVFTYHSTVNIAGNFKPVIPKDIDQTKIEWRDAKLCIGISDFKGIEEKITVNFNNSPYALAPGLPTTDIDSAGLSAAINFSAADLSQKMNFNFNVKIRGSGKLHFLPLSANSKFSLKSKWPNPSFDGNVIPSERNVNEKGFSAEWKFNQANLPFSTVFKDGNFKSDALSFGVSMVQPADQYAKTMRSVKYAILFIGLTFALFFIVELMQQKPLHPMQYVLVGLALVIFYTLLLSISEFVAFDRAYFIASTATVLLITLYAKGHFQSWKVASVFASVLGSLYGFIFILIRLEDTALLVGSIGLFIVLALVMYASRKVNWYQPEFKTTV